MARLSVIFVDDDPRVLRGLRRLLSPLREEWEMHFAESGLEALKTMATQRFDAIVTDMRMPGMDGAELLTTVTREHPHAVRIVLSGQSDQETRLRAAGPTHQFLTKPCTEELLRTTVTRACGLRDILGQEPLRRLVTQLDTLPSLATVRDQLYRELLSADASVATIGDLVDQDIAISAKLLKLVNSSFFGLPQRVTSAAAATRLLGLNVVRELVISETLFSREQAPAMPGFSLEAMRDHATATASFARAIAIAEGQDDAWQADARIAGQLHDIGQLVLAANMPDDYRRALQLASERSIQPSAAESEVFGASHAEVGAYLLGVWGTPDPIVEAVALHDRPAAAPNGSFSILTAVHAASVFAHELMDGEGASPRALDKHYLVALSKLNRVDAWHAACLAAWEAEHSDRELAATA